MPAGKRRTAPKLVPISITTDTLIRILLIGVAAALVYYLWNIVVIFLVAVLLAALIDPFADRLQEKNLPRGFAVAIIYVVILSIVAGAFFLVVPSTVDQLQGMVETYGDQIVLAGFDEALLNAVTTGEFFEQDLNSIVSAMNESGVVNSLPEVFEVLFDAFGSVLTVILVAILAFYMVIEEKELKKGVLQWSPSRYRDILKHVMPKVRTKLGYWLRGQLTIMLIIFVLTFIVLTVLGVPFALVLAIVAGLLEIVPFIGPILATVPAVLIAFSVSPLQALLVALFYFLIQQLEADFLTPKIMQKVVGLNPIVSIMSILIAFELIGFAGALFAVPVAMVIGLVLNEWFAAREKVGV